MRTNLTALFVEHVNPPERGQVTYWDQKTRGLALRVSQGGRKSWVIAYRFEGRLRWLTIGTSPTLSLADAREQAGLKLADVQKGTDPAAVKKEAKAQASWADLEKTYIDDYAKARKRSWKEDDRLLKRYVPAAWAGRKLSGIKHEEVVALHAKVGREAGHYAANHLVRLLRSMFNRGSEFGLLKGANPAAKIRLFEERPRERFLTVDEIGKLNGALAEEKNPYWRGFFALSLLLGTRRSELLTARREWIDRGAKVLRLPETKAGRPHVLALPEAAMAILDSLPNAGEKEGWIFPSRGTRTGHLSEPKAAWKRIRTAAKIADCRLHDLRHSLASVLIQQGYGIQLIGRILNHSQSRTTERYAHLRLDDARGALEAASAIVLGANGNGDGAGDGARGSNDEA
jgi:integrase